MAIRQNRTTTVIRRVIRDECAEDARCPGMEFTDVAVTDGNVTRYQHRCARCGAERLYNEIYPRAEVVEVPLDGNIPEVIPDEYSASH